MSTTSENPLTKQQTSGRLQTANNTIVKRFFFFQIHAPGKCFVSSIMSKFSWYAFQRQHKPPSSPEQRIFLLIFIATIRQIFCLSPLLLMGIWCQFFPSWIPFEHSNFSFRLQPHSPIKQVWSDLRDLNFSFIHAFNKSERHLEFLIYDVIRGKSLAAIFEFWLVWQCHVRTRGKIRPLWIALFHSFPL